MLIIKTGHHPARVFCKISFSGYPGEGKVCSALQLCVGFGAWHSRVSVTACGDGLWSQYDSGQDRTSCRAQAQAGTTNTVKCWFSSSQTKTEKACGGCIQLSKAGRAVGVAPWLLYSVPEAALAAESGFTLSASGDKQRAARVLEPGQG